MAGLGKKIAVGLAAFAGVATFTDALVEGVKSAAAYETLANQTAAVIKSTGSAAGVSVKGIQDYALSLEEMSGVSDTVIINGENILATFTNIKNGVGKGNDIFKQATSATLDLSTAMHEDLQSATVQVGKALNDPIKGMTALQRVGVSFNKDQKEQIKTMVASGNTMGAQKLILSELNKEFGGSAKAAGEGFNGTMNKMKNLVEHTERSIGEALLPTLVKAGTWLMEVGVPAVKSFAEEWGPRLTPYLEMAGNAIKAVGDFLINQLWPAIQNGIKIILPYLQAAWDNISSAFKENQVQIHGVTNALSVVWNFIKTYVIPILAHIIGTELLGLSIIFRKIFDIIFQYVIPGLTAAVKWFYNIDVAIVNAIKAAANFIVGFVNKIRDGVSTVITALGNIKDGTIKVFSNSISWLYNSGKDLITGFLNGGTNIINGIGSWIKHIGDSIVNGIKGFFHISSPSLVMHELGQYAIQGFVNGLSSISPLDIAKTTFGGLPQALSAVVSSGVGGVMSLGAKAINALTGLFGGGGSGVSAGVSKWSQMASLALQLTGSPQSWLNSLMKRMQQESGGNPNAINLTDINAKNGTPSKGLMQVIDPTFYAYAGQYAARGVYDPLANIIAAINYTKARYGSGPAGWNRPGGYDSGGMLNPGYTLAMNTSGKPEHVLTGDQFNSLVGGGSGDTVVNVYLDGELIRGVARVEVQKGLSDAARKINGRRSA